MRLTLRTLLAYLDDILEPSQAKEIGEKIHESTFATSLVNKIQDVVRRRRISAPEVSGPGSTPDPNVVSEYLDNTLAGDAVADLERLCLESDAHLAEVAACHQVLTLVLGEAVDIPADLREHMYSQGAIAPPKESLSDSAQMDHIPKVSGVGAADVVRDTKPKTAEFNLDERLPVELVHPPQRRKTALYVVGAVVLALWVYLTVTDQTLTENFFAQNDSSPAESRLQQPPVGQDANRVDTEPEGDSVEASTDIPNAVADAPADQVEPAEPVEMTPVEPETETSPDVPSPQPTDDPAPAGDALVAAGTPAVTPDPKALAPPTEPVEPEPVLLEPFNVQYVNTSGILLHHEPAEDQWTVLPRRSLLFPGEEVACPKPFDARLTVGDKELVCEVLLLGGARVRSLGPSVNTRFGLEVDQGRLILSNEGNESKAQPVSVTLRIRDDEWTLELLDAEAVVGVEVIPVGPTGVGDMAGATSYAGRIQLQSGSARLTKSPSGQVVELQPGRGLLTFSPTPGAGPAESETDSDIPDWLISGSAPNAITQRLSGRYENEFDDDQPISQSIRPVVKDRQPRISELAAETLALTGRLEGLVDALNASHEETRIAAIEGIRAWLPRNEENGSLLKVELQDRFRGDVAEAINRLLWGYSEQDAKNEFASTELVDWMEHDEVAVRELAAYFVHQLTQRSFGYRAGLNPKVRGPNVRRWREHIQKKGALVGE